MKKINAKAITRNGPNGITFSCFEKYKYKESGKANKLPIKIVKTPSNGSRTSPKRNIILTSPPPILSFLNILFPINIIKYITTNKNIPIPICESIPIKPNFKNWIAIKYRLKKTRTSSGIIKYVKSQTRTITSREIIPSAISKSYV